MGRAVTEGSFITKGDDGVVKHPKDWDDAETKSASYDLKARNILISALSAKVLYLNSHYTSANSMWDDLQTLYEGSHDVNDSKINMFTEEFELFHRNPENQQIEKFGEWKPKVIAIKESNGLSTLDITKLFGKLAKYENELNRIPDSEEEIGLFIRRYNGYLNRNRLKHIDKGLVNFKNTHPPKKDHKKGDDDITCYECGKLGHYRPICPSLTKHHKSKDNDFYKMKRNCYNGCRAYIVWEEEDESSSIDSCSSSDDECVNFHLMARKKGETSKVYNSYFDNEYSYSELSNSFNDMYVDSIKVFKKTSLQKEMILKLEEEISHINHALESLKKAYTSLMDEHCNVSNTLVEKMEVVECVKCPILKLEIEILKGQLTHATSLSCTFSSCERGNIFKKNSCVTKRNRRNNSSKSICHYCGDKGHIRPLCHESFTSAKRLWFLDSGCSRHMTGDASMFIKFDENESGHVTYEVNMKGKILGEGIVGNTLQLPLEICVTEHKTSKDLVFKGSRIENVYMLDLDDVSMYGTKCLVAKSEDSCCKCFILNNRKDGKFDAKSDEGIITERLVDDESSKEDSTPSTKDEDITEDKEERLHENEK
ncbi:uncharacterized protein LOC127123628 [Lathyrus oleraceus]|uniref:uncharacterized protein LOC127123628 n=1 Tax=Pisum sativum TaxID=3888 RepID=UPI0021CE87A7|nr:uncharacterized protein LOC127123628 [Pisum sativum]